MKRIRNIGLNNFIVLISSLLLVVFLITFSFIKNAASAELVAHTWEVKNNIRRLMSSINEMESKKLGYLFTNQIGYRHSFENARKDYNERFTEISVLMQDNENQLQRLKLVDSLVNLNFSDFEVILFSEERNVEEIVLKGKLDQENADQIQANLEMMIDFENSLLDERADNYEIWKYIILITIGIAAVILFLSIYNLVKRVQPLMNELLETKERLEFSNANLKSTLTDLHNSNLQKEAEILAKEKAVLESENLNASLLAKNQQLDHFAYVASHDLQEPLRTVSNYLEIFQEDYPERVEGEATMYFEFINSAVDRMRKLISGLLSFSRLGTSGEMEEVDVNEILNDIIDDFDAIIEEREIVIESDEMPKIHGYKLELKQLFQNLISNAIKFTAPDVTPNIQITVDETVSYFNFHIKDNGIGIPDKDFTKIFDMFSRLHSTKDYDGQGIGLAFCKKIVELHHGNIWVTSDFGVGSTIHFTIKK
ncbi:sensor histidine kinase [Aequorivita echinoideorum]|uniref:histidine kinase n=1 Tax=Aequorivita echinoideorum TaxID=1549647 RepID=A0ABS5S3N1_9FLAO|nr:sensor histidine kinase [Aequorivita echinoideorum]MBT0607002.1 CHASE3 domain-containing protein [Aequorivita echinoideorum]